MNDIRHSMEKVLKEALHDFVLRERDSLQLSQKAMANALLMDTRSYAYIECGETMCGTFTTVLLLIKTPNREKLLSELEIKFLKCAETIEHGEGIPV